MRTDVQMISLSQITPDPDFQPRTGGLVESHIRLLMESDPTNWPPVTVAPDGDEQYSLIDGFHRYEAATRLQLDTLACIVQDGAGYPEAVAANLTHGLPLPIADRKEAARWWSKQEPNLSYREIGRRVGLSDKTVKQAIEVNASEPKVRASTPDPLERWFMTISGLDRLPTVRDVAADIETYEASDRVEVASDYAAIGRILIEASAPYIGRSGKS